MLIELKYYNQTKLVFSYTAATDRLSKVILAFSQSIENDQNELLHSIVKYYKHIKVFRIHVSIFLNRDIK